MSRGVSVVTGDGVTPGVHRSRRALSTSRLNYPFGLFLFIILQAFLLGGVCCICRGRLSAIFFFWWFNTPFSLLKRKPTTQYLSTEIADTNPKAATLGEPCYDSQTGESLATMRQASSISISNFKPVTNISSSTGLSFRQFVRLSCFVTRAVCYHLKNVVIHPSAAPCCACEE